MTSLKLWLMRSWYSFKTSTFFLYNVIEIWFIGEDKIKCFWFGKIKLAKAKLSNTNSNYNKNMQYSIVKGVSKTSYIKENGITKMWVMLHWRLFRSGTCMKLFTNKNVFQLVCSLSLVPSYEINQGNFLGVMHSYKNKLFSFKPGSNLWD